MVVKITCANFYTDHSWFLSLQLRPWSHQGIDNVKTHVCMSMVPSGKVKTNSSQNEWLWHTLDISNVFEPTFGLQNTQ